MNIQEQAALEAYMTTCIRLADIARARGDSPVGSIIVRGDQVISEGIEGGKTHRDITYHAEIEAVRNAVVTLGGTDLSDCMMITTHEPCIMCSYVIRHHKIKRVIIGVTTGEIGGCSSSFPVLTDFTITKWPAPPEIITGILEQACRALQYLKQ